MEMILLVRRVAWNVNGALHRTGISCIIEHISRVHPSIRERVQFSGSLSPMDETSASGAWKHVSAWRRVYDT